jgi:hypothetical protein
MGSLRHLPARGTSPEASPPEVLGVGRSRVDPKVEQASQDRTTRSGTGVVLLPKLDWRAALVLSVSVVFVFGLPVITGYWMARDTGVARYWSPLQCWSREPDEED